MVLRRKGAAVIRRVLGSGAPPANSAWVRRKPCGSNAADVPGPCPGTP